MNEAVIDLAIVGGGVSGIYTGWRLLTADLSQSQLRSDSALNVQLFELSDRIGGRLISLDPPEMVGIKAEFCGMRYLTNQPFVARLVKQLNLATRPFPVSGPENIYYIRGRHLRQAEFANPDKVPYRVRWQERGKTPGQLIMEAIDVLIPGATKLTPEQWLEVKQQYKFNGRYLCPPAMIAHAQRQLQLVHDLDYIPEPYAAGFQDWGQDLFGGAWNSWNIHVKAWEVQGQIVQPLADTAVYIIGEAYSGSQGWIKGALETAEALLQEKWGVPHG